MASVELDPSVAQALRWLHSSGPDAQELLRTALDDLIRVHAGPARTMASVLPRRYLDRERERERDREDFSLELLEEELTCAICRQLAIQAGNRLVECDQCHKLYHQDCHNPVISEKEASPPWSCTPCQNAQAYGASASGSTKTTISASSSNKSSPAKHVQGGSSVKLPFNPIPIPGKVVTPNININIISADKRLQIMKKKAAKQQENKRKHTK